MPAQTQSVMPQQNGPGAPDEIDGHYDRQPAASQLRRQVAAAQIAAAVPPQINAPHNTRQQIGNRQCAHQISQRPEGNGSQRRGKHIGNRRMAMGERLVLAVSGWRPVLVVRV